MMDAVFFVIIFLAVFTCESSAGVVSTERTEVPWLKALKRIEAEARTSEKLKSKTHKWVTEIFSEAKMYFELNNNVSEECSRDFNIYEENVKNQTIWAIRMLESSDWPHMGIFSGVTTFLGNWEECLRSQGPVGIQGQYCLVRANYNYSFAQSYPVDYGWDDWPSENASVWRVLKMYEKIPTRKSRKALHWALCIPSSCSSNDLRNAVLRAIKPIFRKYELDIDVNVDPAKCRIQRTINYPTDFVAALSLLILVVLLVVFSSVYEYAAREFVSQNGIKDPAGCSTAVKIFTCFSIVKSWHALKKHTTNTYTTIYTIKVINFIFIVLAHEAMFSYPFPKLGEEHSELIYKPFKLGLGLHGVVDVFLMMSGFLTFHFGIEPSQKYGVIYYICSIFFRWLRLVPPMSMVIFVMVKILPYVGDGPLFSSHFMNEVKYCVDNWWTNIVAMNNIVNRKEMCLISTWYVAVDFQLTLIGGALLLMLSYNYRLGVTSMVFTFLLGIIMSAYKMWVNHFSGLPMPVILDIDNMRRWPGFADNYIQVSSRIGPYTIGCSFAIVLKKLREKHYQPSVITTLAVLIIAAVVGWGSQLYGFLLLMNNRPYNVLENVLYGVLHRVLIVLPTSCFIVLLTLKRLPIVTDIFELKLFLPLGRLCYCVYLVSLPIQNYYFATYRQLIVGANNMDLFWKVMMDLFVSLLFALVLYFITEGPVSNMTAALQEYMVRKLTGEEKFRKDFKTGDFNQKIGATNSSSSVQIKMEN